MSDQPQIFDNTWEGQGQFEWHQASPCLTFNDDRNQPAVTIHFDPARIELAPGIEWNGAAKLFWNACARMIGQPVPFGW